MELWLIRHGETQPSNAGTSDFEKRTANPKLTPKGIRQAVALAERCRFVHFDRIIASDLDRAVETAQILADGRECTVETDESFREIDIGDIYRTTWDAFPDYHQEWAKHETDMPYPNGECGCDVWERCRGQLEALVQSNHERVAVVCHGGTIRCILCGLLNMSQQNRFLLGDPIMNCSISVITTSKGKPAIHTINDYSHIMGIE